MRLSSGLPSDISLTRSISWSSACSFREAEKNQDVWLLKHLRNAMAHGVRTDNRDAKRLLEDQQALDTKLRALRKSLFS